MNVQQSQGPKRPIVPWIAIAILIAMFAMGFIFLG